MGRTENVLQIIDYAIRSVRPDAVFPALLKDPPYIELSSWLSSSKRYLLSVGKAALSSAEAVLATATCDGYFILAPKPEATTSLKVHYGTHPIPGNDSIQSTAQLLKWLRSLPNDASLLVILSGGSSALMVFPLAGVTSEAKSAVNDLLIRCGASIREINAVRKHLSQVKGGRLADIVPAERTVVLVISDVIGNDLSTIASGPFYPDPTTFSDARRVLEQYEIWDEVSPEVRAILQLGVEGKLPETRKANNPAIPHFIVASNDAAIEAAGIRAQQLGYSVKAIHRPLYGFVDDVAANVVSLIRQMSPSTALILGGEITVKLRGGSGIGGRNLHLALLITEILAGTDAVFAAVGTDGIDGNSRAAGAWTDEKTLTRAMRKGLDLNQSIIDFNSYPFFDALGQTIQTGPTGTNVMDLYIALT